MPRCWPTCAGPAMSSAADLARSTASAQASSISLAPARPVRVRSVLTFSNCSSFGGNYAWRWVDGRRLGGQDGRRNRSKEEYLGLWVRRDACAAESPLPEPATGGEDEDHLRSTEGPARSRAAFGSAYRVVRRGGQAASRRLVTASGGPARTRIVLVLGSVLALSSADAATVGAAAIQLRHALHIGNTDIGLLVAVTAAVGAVFSVPFGVLADRTRRTWLLAGAIVIWGAAMIWGATATSFGELLFNRVWLGAVTAATAPIVASLVGDWIPASERGKIYGYILTGELVGAGIGFAVTGDIAALSWRAAFIILALPAFFLAWLVFRLPEPARGGQGVLAPEPGYGPAPAPGQGPEAQTQPLRHGRDEEGEHGPTDAQRL